MCECNDQEGMHNRGGYGSRHHRDGRRYGSNNNYSFQHGNLSPATFDILIGDAAFDLYRARYPHEGNINHAMYRELEMRRHLQRRGQYLPTFRTSMVNYPSWLQPRW
jgi:hypothetical protein